MWIVADLTFDTDPEAREAERLVREGLLTGVSVDAFPIDYEFSMIDEREVAVITKADLAGATLVPMPAFADAHIQVTDTGYLAWLAPEGEPTSDGRMFSEGSMEPRDPAPMMFQDHTTEGHADAVLVGQLSNFRRIGVLGDPFALVASESQPSLMAVSKPAIHEGELVGHGAAWGVCHTSFPNACVTAPPSESDYAYAQPLKIYRHPKGDFHAPLHLSLEDARAWYETHCETVGLGACGEDPYGIWVNASTSLEDGEVFLSGDWRPDPKGNLELISFLVVDKPGFPTGLVAGESQVALVAAGIVTETDDDLLGRVERLEAVIAAQELLDVLV